MAYSFRTRSHRNVKLKTTPTIYSSLFTGNARAHVKDVMGLMAHVAVYRIELEIKVPKLSDCQQQMSIYSMVRIIIELVWHGVPVAVYYLSVKLF